MQRPKVKAADFVGREAYLAQREAEPQTVLCTLTVDDHTSASGIKRYMLGGEPILTRDGGTLTDGHGHHPYVTTAGSAPSLGKHVLLAYLPPDQATVGNELAVSYMEELYPVTVGSVDATAAARPRATSGCADDHVLVCVKRVVGLLGRGGADRRRPGRRRAVRRLHDERPRGVRGRAGRPDRRRRPGQSASVMTLGDADAVEQLRAALAVGCTAATHVVADPQAFGPADVAREIAAVVRDHEAAHDLVLLGNDAADSGDFQVGIRLAYELGWPVVNGVKPRSSVADGVVTAERRRARTGTRPTGCRCPRW